MTAPDPPAPSFPDLAGKIAVVTGSSRGIGAETARALARNQVAIAVVGRDQPAAESVAQSIEVEGGRAIAIAADCTVEADMTRLHAEVHRQLGGVDILVAFAGGNGMPVETGSETPEHWRAVIDGELTTTFLAVSTFLADLRARSGAIVTMASTAGRQASGSSAAYAAAKAGVIAFSRHLAGELAADAVRVNCLAPAAVENDRMRKYMTEEARSQLGASYPLGRIGQPTDVAAATLFLASAASSWITGITLDVAGGKYMP